MGSSSSARRTRRWARPRSRRRRTRGPGSAPGGLISRKKTVKSVKQQSTRTQKPLHNDRPSLTPARPPTRPRRRPRPLAADPSPAGAKKSSLGTSEKWREMERKSRFCLFSPSHLAVVVVRWVLLPLLGGLQDLVEDLDDVRAVAGGDEEEREIPLGGKVEGLGGHLGVAERNVGACQPLVSQLRKKKNSLRSPTL